MGALHEDVPTFMVNSFFRVRNILDKVV